MKIKVFFDFHDVFVDSKNAWIEAFKEIANNNEIENDYNAKMPKKDICKKYSINYKTVEKLYRKKLRKVDNNIYFAEELSKSYQISVLSMSKKERLLKDIDKFNLKNLFGNIISKDDIISKEEYLKSISKDYDWVIYFDHEITSIVQNDNIIMLPIDLKGDLSKFKNISFTEHAKNKLLYNELSQYYMCAIANDTNIETNFLIKLYNDTVFPKCGKILDCCCGVGRHDYNLASKGFLVTGIDISENQIENAKKIHSHINANYKVMDVRNIDLPIHDYDMSICMWTTYNYLSQEKDFINFVKSNYKHQHKDSILVLDSKNILRLNNRRVYKRNSVSNDGVEIELLVNKYIIGNVQNSQYFYFINDKGNKNFYFDEEFVRFYTLEEITKLTKKYYDVKAVYGDFDFSDYNKQNSNRFIVILKRK